MSTLYLLREYFLGMYVIGFLIFAWVFSAFGDESLKKMERSHRGAARGVMFAATILWPVTMTGMILSILWDAVTERGA